jgi:hypothetical protein
MGNAAPGDPSASVRAVLGQGASDSVELVSLYEPAEQRIATGLAFNPSHRGEIWATLREPFFGEPCNAPTAGEPLDQAACAALEGTVVIIERADTDDPVVTVMQDANAWHFMRRPTGIAFGDDDTFATCGEHRTGTFDDAAADFMGPTLWSASPEVFGPDGPGGNGSHLDMLHATPYCMGIAHERDNAYWTFNGDVGAIDRYDFHAPHEPGGANHTDGEVRRYLVGEVERVDDVPSHLVFDDKTQSLYVVDTGHARVLRLDPSTGRQGQPMRCDDDQLDFQVPVVEDSEVEVVVSGGSLQRPSGIALLGGALYVSDNATSRITAFTLDGREIASLDTGLPAGTLAGIAIGPDGRLYFTDLRTSAVRRVEPR